MPISDRDDERSGEARPGPGRESPPRSEAALKVFECRLCKKVFDSRSELPLCPECDSPDVERLG